MKLPPLLLAVVCLSAAPSEDWRQRMDAANKLASESRHAEAEKLYRAALDVARDWAPRGLPTAVALNALAYCQRLTDRLLEAERGFGVALDIMERELGPTHHRTVNVVVNLASLP